MPQVSLCFSQGSVYLDSLTSLSELAGLMYATDRERQRPDLHNQALDLYRHALGPEHLSTAIELIEMSRLLEAQGDRGAALVLARRALAIRERLLDADHPAMAASLASYRPTV